MNRDSTDLLSAELERQQTIIRTSVIGIVTNVLLAAFKAAVGLLSHSIAVVLDAVNNLSDALSSVITIVGAKLGAKPPDKKHPMGYGRVEYLSALTVAAIVLYAGMTSLVESVKKILTPEAAEYSMVSILIIAVAVVVKVLLGSYVKHQGQKVHSGALVASGSDALFDAVLSASVLACAIVYLVWGISLEAWVGVVLSGFILKAGVEMLTETLDEIIGRRADPELSRQVLDLLNAEPEVYGAYDLLLFNYGPDRYYSTVHLELPDTMQVEEVDRLTRRVQMKVYRQTGVILTGIGVYSFNTGDDEAARIRSEVQKLVLHHDWAMQLHGFYADTEQKTMRFDVVVSFEMDRNEALQIMLAEVQANYPDYTVQIVPDVDGAD